MSIRPGRPRRHDIDEIAVARAVAGDDIRLSPGEGELAVAELHRRGLSDLQIARHLRIANRSAWRIRTRLGLPANANGGQWAQRRMAS